MLDSIHHIEPIMRHAGQLLMSFYHQHLQYFDKKNEGFFTKADVSVEDYLKHALAKLYPEIGFLAEESGQQLGEDQKHQWVIDPLDGTTNFARNIPYFCISIALVLNKKTVFGIIFDPLHDELFWAFEKKGAWQKTIHGIKQLTVSKVDKLERSLVLVGIPYAKNEAFREVFRKAEVVVWHTFAFRHLGAAAMDHVYLACGKVEGLFFENLKWWDFAAGMLLVQEAGGQLSTFEGGPVTDFKGTYVASNGLIHKDLVSFLSQSRA